MRRYATRVLGAFQRSRATSDYGLGGHPHAVGPSTHLNPLHDHSSEGYHATTVPGLSLPIIPNYNEQYSKHTTLLPLETGKPFVSARSFIAPSALLAGAVELGDYSSVWYRVVIRGDHRFVRIGSFVNIQDGTVIREAGRFLNEDHDGSTIIGSFTTIGHQCHISGATIEPCCHVGMGSVLQEGSYMESYSKLAAGSVLEAGARVPSLELWMGRPAKFVRKLTEEEKVEIFKVSQLYAGFGSEHFEWTYELQEGEAYKHAEKLGLSVGYRK